MSWIVLEGDCLEQLRLMEDHSVDAVVTDPPAGIGFMAKGWDKDKGGMEPWVEWLASVMREVHRVLKPGAYGLVWALPRTSHRTGMALEGAGFTIRDRITHMFGTGFPKSLNMGKEIDKRNGHIRPVVGDNPNHRAESGVNYEGVYAGGNTGAAQVTGPGSEESAKWEGFGTGLKPAAEDWWLIQKPREGTYADNVLKYGTGALNIDGCRITTEEKLTRKLGNSTESASGWKSTNRSEVAGKDGGRWPANVVLSHHEDCRFKDTCSKDGPERVFVCHPECPVRILNEQSGPSKSTKGKPRKGKSGDGYGMTHTGAEYTDAGGASRFYYVPKPPRKEKDAGCEHLEAKGGGAATGRKEGSKGTQNPRAGAGRTGGARNSHPTIKGVTLMRYLVRLITPPGGIVLDPFCGSGSTGVAALHEGFEFIGIEAEADYIPIAQARLTHAQLNPGDQ